MGKPRLNLLASMLFLISGILMLLASYFGKAGNYTPTMGILFLVLAVIYFILYNRSRAKGI